MKKVYVFAFLFAVLTGVAVYIFAGRLQKTPQVHTQNVVVAIKKIPERTMITSDMLEIRALPFDAINSLAVTNLPDAVGKVADSTIEVDEQVLSSKLSERDINAGGLAYNVPEGKRAYAIEVDDTTGVAGYIHSGDHVDILASLMMDETAGTTTEKVYKSVLLLQNIEVLITSTKVLNSDEEATGYTIITLCVTPQEAQQLFYAQVNGKITVILRPNLDAGITDAEPYTP